MSPSPPRPTAARSAAVVNAEIRALLRRTGGRPTGADRREYERLRSEWVKAA